MSPTFQGRAYKQPGAYSYTDPTSLVAIGLGTGGVCAIIGPATGGESDEVTLFTDPVTAQDTYRGGALIDAANYAWAQGANQIYLTRAGTPLQSAGTFVDAVAANTLTVTAQDYGVWGDDIKVKVEDATVGGPAKCKVTVQYYNDETGETITETGDELTDATAIKAYWDANYAAGLVAMTAVKPTARPVNVAYTNLTGGFDDATPDATEWSTAIDLYKTYEVNMMHLAGCTSATQHAYLSAHCTTMSNNRKERIGIVGGPKGESVGDTSTGIIKRAYDLNSDRMVLASPGLNDEDACYTAARILGMLAGVDVATSITHQTLSATSIEMKFTDSEKDDLITYGVCAVEEVPQGRRIIRGITTAQDLSTTTENPFKEISIRRIADYINYNMRNNLEAMYIGKKGVTGIEASIQSSTTSILVRLREAEIIQDFRNVIVKRDTSNPQIVYVNYEVAPISPINYIFITTKLVPIIQ